MQPPLASFLLLTPPLIADSKPFLMLMKRVDCRCSCFLAPILLCVLNILLYFADLDPSCRLRLPMQPLLASFLLPMPSLTADSNASDADSAASGAHSNASDGDSSDLMPIPFDSDADAADSDADAASSNADIPKWGLAVFNRSAHSAGPSTKQ